MSSLPLNLTATLAIASTPFASSAVASNDDATVRHRTMTIDGIEVFYREAGPKGAPTVVLLHGFPTSSNMFRNLIPKLAPHYRVIAPDFPGFGQSAVPDRASYAYTFDNIAKTVDALLEKLGATNYALYVMDYGAPVGFRIALAHPERVTALVAQNGNAYEEGLQEFWVPLKKYWASGSNADREALRPATSLEGIRWQYLDGVRDPSRIDPTTWLHDNALVSRPGNVEIQLDLFYDYRTNLELYPRVHAFFREHRPPTLIVWGANDQIFPADGARAYLKDLPDAELHLLDTGHFSLEDKGDEIAAVMLDFFARKLPRS